MGNRRTSIFENGLIWFGAGVSLAEILTGTYFASLGFSTGLLAIRSSLDISLDVV